MTIGTKQQSRLTPSSLLIGTRIITMIKKIISVKNFGSFEDYRWNCKKEFNKLNIIFGWNYSGKTTLSRIFRSFETQENYHFESSFELHTEGGKKLTEMDLHDVPNIRVFNKDYVKANLNWNDSEIRPFAVIGRESIELMEHLNELEKKKKDLNDYISE